MLSALSGRLPAAVADAVVQWLEMDPARQLAQLTRAERKAPHGRARRVAAACHDISRVQLRRGHGRWRRTRRDRSVDDGVADLSRTVSGWRDARRRRTDRRIQFPMGLVDGEHRGARVGQNPASAPYLGELPLLDKSFARPTLPRAARAGRRQASFGGPGRRSELVSVSNDDDRCAAGFPGRRTDGSIGETLKASVGGDAQASLPMDAVSNAPDGTRGFECETRKRLQPAKR